MNLPAAPATALLRPVHMPALLAAPRSLFRFCILPETQPFCITRSKHFPGPSLSPRSVTLDWILLHPCPAEGAAGVTSSVCCSSVPTAERARERGCRPPPWFLGPRPSATLCVERGGFAGTLLAGRKPSRIQVTYTGSTFPCQAARLLPLPSGTPWVPET